MAWLWDAAMPWFLETMQFSEQFLSTLLLHPATVNVITLCHLTPEQQEVMPMRLQHCGTHCHKHFMTQHWN